MRYSDLPRFFDPYVDPSVHGYRWTYGCMCGHRFNEKDRIDVVHHRATWEEPEDGSSYCPECGGEDFDEMTGPHTFKATKRRTLQTPSMRNAA